MPRSPAPFDLLVFDWDGTLMDSIGSIVACMEQVVEDLTLAPIPPERIRGTVGLGLVETLEVLAPEADEEGRRTILARYRELWFAGYRDRAVLFPGAREALADLRDRGYLLAVATGKSRRGLERDLAAAELGGFFAATRTADEAFSKPHPEMLLGLLEELGRRPESALMIGDSIHDLRMARNAGIAAVAVLSGSHRREELSALSPLACLPSVRELPGWLGAARATSPQAAGGSSP